MKRPDIEEFKRTFKSNVPSNHYPIATWLKQAIDYIEYLESEIKEVIETVSKLTQVKGN